MVSAGSNHQRCLPVQVASIERILSLNMKPDGRCNPMKGC
jgi:hypothetical protein